MIARIKTLFQAVWIAVFLTSATNAQADYASAIKAFDGGDQTKALAEILRLAGNGDARAQNILAEFYIAGYGVRPNKARAYHWYGLAARQGIAIAQLNLGTLYEDGLGAPRDLVRAYMWYEIAAKNGQAVAASFRDKLARKVTALQRRKALELVRGLTLKLKHSQ